MAITNAQQYQQLVKKPSGNERPGYRGPGGYQSGKSDPKEGTYSAEVEDNRGFNDPGPSKTQTTVSPPRGGGVDAGAESDFKSPSIIKRQVPPGEKGGPGYDDSLDYLYNQGVGDSGLPGVIGAGIDFFQPVRDFSLRKNIDYFRGLKSRGRLQDYALTAQGYKDYMRARMAGEIDAAGNPIMQQDDDDQPIIPIIPQDSGIMDQAIEEEFDNTPREEGILARAFRADGGIMGGLADGQIDEMGRQMYGLGKLVKKATRAVKKIVKSPIGKAALLYTGAGALSNLAGGSGLAGMFKGFTSPKSFLAKEGLKNIFTREGLGNILVGGKVASLGGNRGMGAGIIPEFSGLLGTGGELSLGKVFTLASVLPLLGLGTGDETEQQAKEILDNTAIDIDRLKNDTDYQNAVLARQFRAGGGLMRLGYQEGGDAEPVAKKTMPLLDMDGMEKDYRETGGFVDMGRMERADDVPARLSKNEFVFTADAVRNAGDGNVDKGAEVMYNMMKNLEAGGEVSEESQGLEGARRMFQTSQRLEEVL